MKVVADQRPSIAVGTGFRQQFSQTLHKVVTIIIVPENCAPFNPSLGSGYSVRQSLCLIGINVLSRRE